MRRLIGFAAMAALAACSSGEEPAQISDSEGREWLQMEAAPADAEEVEEEPAELTEPQKYLASFTSPRQLGPYAPRDECSALTGATEFREKIAAAVLARDADAFAALAARDIRLDFGGGSGVAELRNRLAAPEQELWRALRNLMPLGCAANSQSTLTIPWYFAQDVAVDDPYLAMIVRGVGVPLRNTPAADGRILARLSWDVVEVQESPGAFTQVRTTDGTTGYIESSRLRSLIDYRLIADRRDGEWKIVALLAGD